MIDLQLKCCTNISLPRWSDTLPRNVDIYEHINFDQQNGL